MEFALFGADKWGMHEGVSGINLANTPPSPPVAAQMIKRSVNAISGALDRSVMHMDFDQHHLAADTSDAAEAVSAYLEKRPPTFTGN